MKRCERRLNETDDRGQQHEGGHKDGDHEDKLQDWNDPKEVRRARLKEIQYIKDKKVWRRISRQEALRRGYKTVKGRWIGRQYQLEI